MQVRPRALSARDASCAHNDSNPARARPAHPSTVACVHTPPFAMAAPSDAAAAGGEAAAKPALPTYTLAEVKKHATASDLWLVINGKVYNVTRFQDMHPGGSNTLLDHAGERRSARPASAAADGSRARRAPPAPHARAPASPAPARVRAGQDATEE